MLPVRLPVVDRYPPPPPAPPRRIRRSLPRASRRDAPSIGFRRPVTTQSQKSSAHDPFGPYEPARTLPTLQPMGKQRSRLASVIAAVGFAALYHWQVRQWIYTWGARDDEVAARMPGDDLVVADIVRTTRAITIDAPPVDVWPWLAQIGEDRGGFYSYSLLEQAAGARIHNADYIHPEWQELRAGQTIWLSRRYGDRARQVVADVRPMSHLVLMSPADFEGLQKGQKALGAWIFQLRQEGGGTRLIVRSSGGAVGRIWFDIVHFVMEQKMMRGIRARAERSSGSGLRPGPLRTGQVGADGPHPIQHNA